MVVDVTYNPGRSAGVSLNVLEPYKAIGYRDLHYIYDLLAVTYRYKGDFSKYIFYGSMAIESVEAMHAPL